LSEVFRTQSLIEQKLLFTRFGTMDQSIDNNHQFVGYIINVANDFDISTQINTATLYFDQDVSFNLYLFMDGIKNPLKTIPVSCVAYQRTVIHFDSLILNYEIGRKYYFAYFQDELGTARAIREQVDIWATTRCFESYPYNAPAISAIDFNHNYRQYGFLPQGLNLEMISFRDHTQRILRKANLFDEAIGLTVAVMVLEAINTSTRSNVTERQTKMVSGSLYQDINQAFATEQIPLMPGLKSRLVSEYKKLIDSFYPKAEATVYSQEVDSLGIESSWYKQNLRQITNPPIAKY
jgi:hypothetical protein